MVVVVVVVVGSPVRPKQMVEEMNEKMRKKLGPEHKDMADTVVKTQERLRNTSMCFILTLSKNGLLTQ